MNVGEALIIVRQKINDYDEVGLSDEELLHYINEAAQYVSQYLASSNSPLMVKEQTLTAQTNVLPANFLKTCGTFPIKITGNVIELLDDPPLKIRYTAGVDRVSYVDDMPFQHEALNQFIVKLATIYALNQEELDVSQDKALLGELQASIASAIGAAVVAAQ